MEERKENDMAIWIVSETTLGRNAKVLRFARTLGIEVPQALGHLHLLWHSVLEQKEDGDITKWTDEDIEFYASWEGKKGAFVKAMRDEAHRFIDDKDGMVLIHDWLETAGRYLKRKYGGKKEARAILQAIYAKHGKTLDKDEEELPAAEPDTKDAQKFVQQWNEFIQAQKKKNPKVCLMEIQELTPARTKLIKARMKHPKFPQLFTEMANSNFLLGSAPKGKGHENWKPSIDFILKQATFTNIFEGKYRNNGKQSGQQYHDLK